MFKDVMLTLFFSSVPTLVTMFTLKKVFDKNIKLLSLKFLLCYIMIIVVTALLYMITDSFIRIIFLYCYIVSIFILVYKESISKTIVSVFLGYLVVTISEIVTVIIFSFFNDLNNVNLKDMIFLNIGMNVSIFISSLVFINIPIVTKGMKKLVEKSEKLNISKTFLLAVIGMLLIGSFLYCAYFELSITYLLILNILILLLYMGLVYNYTKEINDKKTIEAEYNSLINNLEDYEKLYEYQRVQNHENKNQLLMIRSLVKKDNKKLLNYIDEVTKVKFDEDNEMLKKLRKLPYGGLRGLLYSKFLQIEQQNKINLNLIISKDIELGDFKSIDDETNKDLCKILGILLDNAIEACEKTKYKQITVQIYKCNNELVFTIENNINSDFYIDKIYEKGYSTKGKGRGYGLYMVREMINRNCKIENNTKVIAGIFIQIIKIKM